MKAPQSFFARESVSDILAVSDILVSGLTDINPDDCVSLSLLPIERNLAHAKRAGTVEKDRQAG